ncbi:uncharacterized protein LOC134701167 [Mytilus trossulus]|uniref:uncharacterized protein LOC134701167 n=1 Tax=Mytilus trossulus TaxID=6551 RepID=UPI003005BF81
MPPTYGPRSPELDQGEEITNHMIVRWKNKQMVMAVQKSTVQNSTPKNVFVALDNSTPMTGTVVNQTAISNQQCAITASKRVTSQEPVHSKEPNLQQSAHQKTSCQNQHEVNSSQSSFINEVEYSFDIINNYETESGKTLINVKGNLRRNVEFWKNVLCANDFIINTINLGYRIPFVSEPNLAFLRNNMAVIKYSDFVEKSIFELLDSHCIKEVRCPPFVVNPLTVSVQSSGKMRLVLDLRHVNQYVDKQKVKFEGVNEALNYAVNAEYGYKFDFRSGYHHIDIHDDHQKY